MHYSVETSPVRSKPASSTDSTTSSATLLSSSANATTKPKTQTSNDQDNTTLKWLRCVAVVCFDVDAGQVTEYCMPNNALSPEERKRIAYLSLPDSYNSDQDRDGSNVDFTFRTRRDTSTPLVTAIGSSHAPHSYDYGYVYFRRSRDPSVRRGYVQKAVVVVTPAPFTGLFHRVARILGPLYFEYGETILESAYRNMSMWPAPKSGLSFDLPLVGHILHFRVPWTGDDWDGGKCANVTDEEIKKNEKQQRELNGGDGSQHGSQNDGDSLEDSRDYNRYNGGGSSPVRRSSLTDVFRAKVRFFFYISFSFLFSFSSSLFTVLSSSFLDIDPLASNLTSNILLQCTSFLVSSAYYYFFPLCSRSKSSVVSSKT